MKKKVIDLKILLILSMSILMYSQDRYNEDEINKDINRALGWIKSNTKKVYKIAKKNLQKDTQTIKKAYKNYTTDKDGRPLSKEQIIKKLEKSAQQGSLKAKYYLGVLYLKGKDAYKNRDKIYKNFKESALGGYVASQYELGKLYHKGLYMLKPDRQKALFWLNKAKNSGSKEAKEYLERFL